ncbi:outer membrane lipoprotein chaperone LolA [Rheinheimera sp. MMS21-TC3]|uniref:outer membrane lipoprotein chaperone LolA n=1 Tax=Rheinheimera sp. MMS21-TC3 TaxID=3072790 RepID=UPI0028C4B7A3|nr:outer membrane lipoprotein chaperone LolA [Rheinheimera sp. MMS21-TC3]WNO60911.1 outer membrane lipoprotein chaperone LolA [Rheinheimera sp. MMS21-TC3]
MIRFLVTTVLFSTLILGVFTAKAEPTAAQALQQKLQQIDTFSAHFTQQVFDQQQQILQQAEGELNLKQPELFRFETTVPENNIFIGDGQSLWFYSAELEQLTIYDAAAEVNRTPFVLLTSNEPALWENFNVKQQQQQFIISAKDSSSQVTELILIFNKTALSEMRVMDINQQLSVFKFNAVQLNIPLADSLFQFSPPEFTEIDDQRSRN